MDEEEVNLIVQAIAQGFDEVRDELAGVGTQSDAASESVTKLDSSSGSLNLSMTELRSTISLARQGLAALDGVYNATVGSAVTYAQTVEQVADVSGTSTEQASRMTTVLGDLGIQANSMTMAVKTLTKEGLQFNLDTLEKLATQYQTIQDPVAKDKFLFDNFGRSGSDLALLMSQPVSKLKELEAEVDATGKVMSGPDAQALVDYGIKVKQLDDNWQGLTVQLSQSALPALSDAVKQETANFQAIDILNKQVEAGHISRADMVFDLIQIEAGLADTNKFVQENITWLQGDSTASRQLRDDWDALAQSQADNTTAVNDNIQNLDHLNRILDGQQTQLTITETDTSEYTRSLLDMADAQKQATEAQKAANDELDKAVQAGVAGTLAKNELAYYQVLAQNNPKIADLKEQIAKLTAAQGEQITTTQKGQYTAEQFAVAQEHLQIAEERLAETHSHSKATLDSLKLSVQQAQDKVNEMSGHLATSSTTTADYSTKIADLNGQLNDLQGAEDKAADAMKKANAQFLYDQAATFLDAQGKLDLARSLGIIDEKTYDAATAIQTYGKQLQDKTIDQVTFNSKVDAYADSLNGVGKASDQMPTELQPATDAFVGQGKAVSDATTAVLGLHDGLDQLQDKTITVTVNHVDVYTTRGAQDGQNAGQGGVPRAASGADFIVPPGFYGDNYPVMAQSGERVVVIPQGQPGNGAPGSPMSGGGGDTVYINDRLAAALYLETRRQKNFAQLESAMS